MIQTRLIARNAAAVIGGRAANMVLGAAASILLTRYLGSARLGEYGLIYAYLTLFGWLTTIGLESVLPREIANDQSRTGVILGTGVTIATTSAFIGVAVAAVLFPRIGYPASLRWLVVIASIEMIVFPSLRLAGSFFLARSKLWYREAASTLRQVLWLGSIALLVFDHGSLTAVVVLRVLCAAPEIMLLVWGAKRIGSFTWGVDRSLATPLVRAGIPVAFSTLAVTIYHRIDQLMLGRMVPLEELGNYVAAVTVTEVVSVFPVALMSAIFPMLVTASPEHLKTLRDGSYRYLMCLSALIAVGGTLLSPWIVPLVYGPTYMLSSRLLTILVWSEIPVFFGVVITNVLVARNLQRVLPIATVAGALTNIVLNLVLIPRYGAVGAAVATVISYAVGGNLMYQLIPSARPHAVKGLRFAARAIAAALVATALAQQMPVGPIAQTIAGCGLGIAACFGLRLITRDDLRRAGRLLRRVDGGGAPPRSGEVLPIDPAVPASTPAGASSAA